MDWIDVVIPGVGGLLAALRPEWFAGQASQDPIYFARLTKLRRIGFALLAVASLYWFIKVSGTG